MKATFFLLAASLTAAAQTLPTIRVSDEIVPPGGMAQMKVLLTSPKPITTGMMDLDLSGVSFDSIDGIALFSSTGDVVGAATVVNGNVNASFTSPNSTFGSDAEYPILTVALRLSKFVVPGQKFTVALNPNTSFWKDLLGTVAFELKPGSITVGGSVSITNVVPGGGFFPAGAQFSIFGMGFTSNTKITVKGISTSSIQYISPTEFRVSVKDGGQLDGALISAQNPDKSTDTYYSYMRGVPQGVSARPLLAQTVPVFSLLTATEAVLPSTVSSLNNSYWTGLALQNPALQLANITVQGRDSVGNVITATAIALPSGARLSREVSELLGATLPVGGYLHIGSDRPVQAVGILGNDATGSTTPLAISILAGPPAPAPPPPTVSGGGGGGGGTSGGSGSGKTQ